MTTYQKPIILKLDSLQKTAVLSSALTDSLVSCRQHGNSDLSLYEALWSQLTNENTEMSLFGKQLMALKTAVSMFEKENIKKGNLAVADICRNLLQEVSASEHEQEVI